MIPNRAGFFMQQPAGYKSFVPSPLPPDPPIQIDAEMFQLLASFYLFPVSKAISYCWIHLGFSFAQFFLCMSASGFSMLECLLLSFFSIHTTTNPVRSSYHFIPKLLQ